MGNQAAHQDRRVHQDLPDRQESCASGAWGGERLEPSEDVHLGRRDHCLQAHQDVGVQKWDGELHQGPVVAQSRSGAGRFAA
jgi:hypothetical protein